MYGASMAVAGLQQVKGSVVGSAGDGVQSLQSPFVDARMTSIFRCAEMYKCLKWHGYS
jgi:hypothetical protein